MQCTLFHATLISTNQLLVPVMSLPKQPLIPMAMGRTASLWHQKLWYQHGAHPCFLPVVARPLTRKERSKVSQRLAYCGHMGGSAKLRLPICLHQAGFPPTLSSPSRKAAVALLPEIWQCSFPPQASCFCPLNFVKSRSGAQ